MPQLYVRKDWLENHINSFPEWATVLKRVIEMNAFIVTPARGTSGNIVVDVDQIKGRPPVFAFHEGYINCVNYGKSFKPMTELEFITFIRKTMEEGFSEDFYDRMAIVLTD